MRPWRETNDKGCRDMRIDMMEVLACPICKLDLTLNVTSEDGDEITAGTLTCGRCNEVYPVDDGVPNLLPAEYRGAPEGQ